MGILFNARKDRDLYLDKVALTCFSRIFQNTYQTKVIGKFLSGNRVSGKNVDKILSDDVMIN